MAEIKQITKKQYSGKVCDLTVDGAQSYNIDGLIVHNSGVASLCLYSLNVTALDPVKYHLAFERFLNPNRISPPDVDIDFEYAKRDELFMYVADKYGQQNICRIGTYGKLKAKDAIKRVGKVMDIGNDYEAANEKERGKSDWRSGKNTLQIIDQISKCIPTGPDITVDNAISSIQELQPYVQLYPKVFKYARKIEGTISNQGLHPAGIIVCKDPVVEYVPLRVSDSTVCTQFDMREIENLGLLKYDFLALKNLTMTEQCVQLIRKRYNINIDPNVLEPDDPKVFDVFNRGDTEGIFQFEGASITRLTKELHVDTFNDLVVINALHRPGTMSAKIPKEYCRYKHGEKSVVYLHPMMEGILKETYGMMCFSERQVVYGVNGPRRISEIKDNSLYWHNSGFLRADLPIPNRAVRSGYKQTYEYRLSNGESIYCTKDHKLLTTEGRYVEVDRIFSGEMLLPLWNGAKYKLLKSNSKGSYESCKEMVLCYLLGALIGDGAMGHNRTPVLCVGKDKKYARKICTMVKKVFSNAKPKIYWSCRSWYVRMGFDNSDKFGTNRKNELLNLLRELGLAVVGESKRIPFSFLEEKRENYLAILAGLIDTDGCISKTIFYTSANPDLIEDVCYALWKLGYYFWRTKLRVFVYDSVKLFDELSNFLVKKRLAKRPIYRGKSVTVSSRAVSKKITEMLLREGCSGRSFCKEYGFNRSTFKKILGKSASPMCKWGVAQKVLDSSELIEHAAVKIVDRFLFKKEDVYDVSMPPESEHNFLLSSGIVAHNCYQEDVMMVSMKLAGFTPAQSYKLMKGMGKKKQELIIELKSKFIDGCVKNGIEKATAEKIYELCEFFSGYGFNKCLGGNTTVVDADTNKVYRFDELFKRGVPHGMRLFSLKNGRRVKDVLIDVFETGEQELFEVKLSNGMIFECTMKHKFYCSDGEEHELQDIIGNELEIICDKIEE